MSIIRTAEPVLDRAKIRAEREKRCRSFLLTRHFPTLARSSKSTQASVVIVKDYDQPETSNEQPTRTREAGSLFNSPLVKSSDAHITALKDFRSSVLGRSSPRSPRTKKGKTEKRKPFCPCNPSQAKKPISDRAPGHLGTEFGAEHDLKLRSATENRTLFVGGTFVPSGSDAGAAVRINYYLNSADEASLAAEKRYLREKGRRNRALFNEKLRAMRRQGRGNAVARAAGSSISSSPRAPLAGARGNSR